MRAPSAPWWSCLLSLALPALTLPPVPARAGDPNLSIAQIQYTTDPAGVSPHAGQVVNCRGGIVTLKWQGWGPPRLVLYDPAHAAGWGAVELKDWSYGTLCDNVSPGDWVSLKNVWVEEAYGNTLLQYDYPGQPPSGFRIEGRGYGLPRPLTVGADEIPAPLYDPQTGCWRVADHAPEKYEAMPLQVEQVTVGTWNLGKADDNYVLQQGSASLWASDYLNPDLAPHELYHPYVQPGRTFCRVTGILEQYTKNGWDYYQLLTTGAASFTLPDPNMTADLDGNCRVDFDDFTVFSGQWLAGGTEDPNHYRGADLNRDDHVDRADLADFADQWLIRRL